MTDVHHTHRSSFECLFRELQKRLRAAGLMTVKAVSTEALWLFA